MSNPNFVSDLVAMAKAFEELPQVRAELEAKTHDHNVAQQMIQRLELRLIDLKTELDAAHAATRKVEVERDHAERMFHETDDRLNAFRRLLGSFQTEAGALIAAAEPEVEPKPEPEVKPIDEHGQVIYQPEPGPAIGDVVPLGQSEQDPTLAVSTGSSHTDSSSGTAPTAEPSSATVHEAVSVQPDPTQATPDAQHSPAGSSASAGETSATTESAGSTRHDMFPEPEYYQPAEAAKPVDPTASSTAGDGHSPESATLTTDAIALDTVNTQEQPATAPSDDVGYHNEPQIKPGDGGWIEWDHWCERMNLRYPRELGGWPPRNAPATA